MMKNLIFGAAMVAASVFCAPVWAQPATGTAAPSATAPSAAAPAAPSTTAPAKKTTKHTSRTRNPTHRHHTMNRMPAGGKATSGNTTQ